MLVLYGSVEYCEQQKRRSSEETDHTTIINQNVARFFVSVLRSTLVERRHGEV